jgi:hypothetical protein
VVVLRQITARTRLLPSGSRCALGPSRNSQSSLSVGTGGVVRVIMRGSVVLCACVGSGAFWMVSQCRELNLADTSCFNFLSAAGARTPRVPSPMVAVTNDIHDY